MATDISAGDMPVRPEGLPDIDINVEQAFGFKSDLTVKGYSEITEHVPQLDESYRLDRATTLAILAGFEYNRRGPHPGLSRHRQIDPYRAGRGPAQLALRAPSTSTATSAASI